MTYSLTLTQEQIDIVINAYLNYEVPITNYYTLFRAKIKFSTLTIYTTGKVLIQGKDSLIIYNDINTMFGFETKHDIESPNKKEIEDSEDIILFKSYIGNDEVGTGDFFGPIIVCSACVNEDNYLRVKRLGVKDSKAITSDDKILSIGEELITFVPYSISILDNTKYNEITLKPNMNMNKIKAIMHNNVMNKFLVKYPDLDYNNIVLDDFCGEDKYYEYLSKSKNVIRNIIFETKAENKYLSVATASIIARYFFLKEIEKISKESGFEIQKGASNKVDIQASQIIKEKGTNYLSQIAKLNFKNFDKAKKILNNQLNNKLKF